MLSMKWMSMEGHDRHHQWALFIKKEKFDIKRNTAPFSIMLIANVSVEILCSDTVKILFPSVHSPLKATL